MELPVFESKKTTTTIGEVLDSLMAYDCGCTDSGVKDEELRREVKDYLVKLNPDELRFFAARHVRDHYLSEKALEAGYGWEDVESFVEWLEERFGVFP